MKKFNFIIGMLCGAIIFGSVSAVATGIMAELSKQKIYVDRQQIEMTAYSIGGNNYVKLRDIGKAVNFGVSYDGATDSVYIDSKSSYSEETPSVKLPDQTTGETLFLSGEIDMIVNGLPEEYAAVKPFVDELLAMPTNHEKINAIVRYVCDRMTYGEAAEGTYTRIGYDFGGNTTRSMRYAMFIDAPPVKGWCFHYSKAVDFLCVLSGVPTVMIESYKSDHAWNAVYTNGAWHYVDATNASAKLKLYPDADVIFTMDTPNLPFSDDNPEQTKNRMEIRVPNSTK